jgi:hypothetical protein
MNRLRGFKKQKGPPAIKHRQIDRDLYLGVKRRSLIAGDPADILKLQQAFDMFQISLPWFRI